MTKRNNSGLSMAGAQAPMDRPWAALEALWSEQLGELATACAGSFAEEECDRVRALHDLLATVPDAALIRGLVVPCPGQVEDLLDSGAAASAVLAMFGPAAGYILSRGATGLHAASVILPGAEEDVTAIGDSLALALAGAMAQALLDRLSARATAPLHLN